MSILERRAYVYYLRTGRRLPPHMFTKADGLPAERKYNPWHDELGRFTFANTGNYFPPRFMRTATSVPPAPTPLTSVAATPLPKPPAAINKAGKHAVAHWQDVQRRIRNGATRIVPIPGGGRPARRGERAPNGGWLSDGRFSLEGAYRRYSNGDPKPHQGVDFPAKIGEPVLAAASGVVEERASRGDFGNKIVINHGDGTRSLYAHFDKEALVEVGDHVSIGQQIGEVGVSGNAAGGGSHLHLEISDTRFPRFGPDARRIDPLKWLKDGGGLD